jgi:hypothetical protein
VDSVDQYIGHAMTAPMAMAMTAESAIAPHNNCYLRPYRSSNCTCGADPCRPIPVEALQCVRFSQCIPMSLRLDRGRVVSSDQPLCILSYMAHASRLDQVFRGVLLPFQRADCNVLGCPWLPLLLQMEANLSWLPGVGRICAPV